MMFLVEGCFSLVFSQAAYAKSCRQDSYRNGGLLACKILKRPRPCSSAQSKPVWVEQIGGVAQLFVPAGFLVIIRFCAQDFRAWGEVQDREAADDGRIPAPWCWTCHFPDQYHRGCWGMLKNEGGLFQFCWTKYSLLCSQRCLPRWLKKRNASHWRCATPHLTW